MPRVKLELPEKILATFEVPVRISDINYGNHLGNDALVSILHEARVQWLRTLNMTEMDVGGVGLIMSDLEVQFKAEVYYGDVLTVTILTDTPSAKGFELFYSVSNSAKDLVAKAKTGMVCFDYDKKKIAPIPAVLMDILLA
jgi:acyl-CoA thioesterase FadM